MLVALDAGHGLGKPGCAANDLRNAGLIEPHRSPAELTHGCEADLTTDTVIRLGHHLRLHGIETVETRASAFGERVRRAQGADAFVSVHFNAPPPGQGIEVLYWQGDVRGRAFAQAMLDGGLAGVRNSGMGWRTIPSRGLKARDDLYLLKHLHAAMPTCLVECAFALGDADLVRDKRWRELLATGLAAGIVKYLTAHI